jgi:hypothetical protein
VGVRREEEGFVALGAGGGSSEFRKLMRSSSRSPAPLPLPLALPLLTRVYKR